LRVFDEIWLKILGAGFVSLCLIWRKNF